MWLILQQDTPDDFVIATNEAHSVKEFAEKAFSVVGLDWEKYVSVDERFKRPLDVNFLQGDYSKAKQKLGWEPKVNFDQLAEIMVKEDMARWRSFQEGKRFPWDATRYPHAANTITRPLRS